LKRRVIREKEICVDIQLKRFYKPVTNKIKGYIFNLKLFSKFKNLFPHIVNAPEG